MSYCLAAKLDQGLVLMADSLTNAGVDNISRYPKVHNWSVPGERQIYLLTAGNLATSQAVIGSLEEKFKSKDERQPSILETASMYQTAQLVGEVLRGVIQGASPTGQEASGKFDSTLILGGQIGDAEPRLYLIYPEGNFIEASQEQPYLQIGEAKYGKPILVRGFDETLSFEEAAKLFLLSFDSTIKTNLSVGMPLDMYFYEGDSLSPGRHQRISDDNEYFKNLSKLWEQSLKQAMKDLPNFEIEES
jgi:putative proteasome-type protease